MTVASPDWSILSFFFTKGCQLGLASSQCAVSCFAASVVYNRGAVSRIVKWSMRGENGEEMTATQHKIITETVNINVFMDNYSLKKQGSLASLGLREKTPLLYYRH